MTIDEFVSALKRAAPDFRWKLERQNWGSDDDRLCLRASVGDFKTDPIGAVCRHRGRGDNDVGNYVRSANAIGLSAKSRRAISFACNQSPMADPALRGRILAQVDL